MIFSGPDHRQVIRKPKCWSIASGAGHGHLKHNEGNSMTTDTPRRVLPGDDAYARLAAGFNVAVPATPAMIVEARDAEDVARAVRYAGEHGLPAAVRATGHGVAGTLDGALLVHTGRLDE